jgi:hypothetical protein
MSKVLTRESGGWLQPAGPRSGERPPESRRGPPAPPPPAAWLPGAGSLPPTVQLPVKFEFQTTPRGEMETV